MYCMSFFWKRVIGSNVILHVYLCHYFIAQKTAAALTLHEFFQLTFNGKDNKIWFPLQIPHIFLAYGAEIWSTTHHSKVFITKLAVEVFCYWKP